jgi:hypothetical protein
MAGVSNTPAIVVFSAIGGYRVVVKQVHTRKSATRNYLVNYSILN